MKSNKTPKLAAGMAAVAVAAVIAAVLLSTGSRTGDPAGRLLRLVPADSTAVVLVPRHETSLMRLLALHDRFAQAVPGLPQIVGEYSRRVGFDLLRPSTLADIGGDPDGGTIVAAGPDWAGVWIAVKDPATFQDNLEKRLLGRGLTWEATNVQGLDARIARTAGEKPAAVLALAYVDGHALIVPSRSVLGEDVDPLASLARLAAVTEATSLASRPDVGAELSRVGGDQILSGWFDLHQTALVGGQAAAARGRVRDSQALQELARQVKGVAFGLDATADAVRIPLAFGADDARLTELKAAMQPTAKGPDYARLVPPDGILLVSAAFHPNQVLPWLRTVLLDLERDKMDQAFKELALATGTDIERDVMTALSGHIGFVFHTIDLAAGLQELLKDLSSAASAAVARPGAVTTTTYVGLSDPARIQALLDERLAQLGRKEGYEYVIEPVESRPAWRLRSKGIEAAGIAVVGDVLVFTTGRDRLSLVLAHLDGKAETSLGDRVAVPAGRRGLSPDNNLGLFLSVPVLMSNFPILNLLPVVKRPTQHLGELVVRLQVGDTGVDGEVMLTLRTPPPPAAPGTAPKPAAGAGN